jgi:hypothetical protein
MVCANAMTSSSVSCRVISVATSDVGTRAPRIFRPPAIVAAVLIIAGSGLTLLNIFIVSRIPAPFSDLAAPPHPALLVLPDAPPPEGGLAAYVARLRQGQPFAVDEANDRVFRATAHSDDRRIRWDENWLQWLAGHWYPPLARTQRTPHLIAGRAANCSERSQILKTIAEQSGCQCRFIGLSGHVVLEVNSRGQWRVADPDYGVTYPFGLQQLQAPEAAPLIQTLLSRRGFPPEVIDRYLAIVGSVEDNVVLDVGSPLSPRLYAAEQACAWLVWIIPALCLWSGVFASRARRQARPSEW